MNNLLPSVSTDLKKQALEVAKKYQGLLVTVDENSRKQARKATRELNKPLKELEEYRKDKKREYLKPLKQFEADVKEIEAPLSEQRQAIKKQLDELEEIDRAKRLENIKELAKGMAINYGIDWKLIDFSNRKLTNKTTSQHDILDILAGQMKALSKNNERFAKMPDGSFVNTETGEKLDGLFEASFTIRGSRNQLDEISRFIANSGVQIIQKGDE